MAVIHYTARVKDNRTLELPEEALALGLHTGDEVHIFVDQGEIPLQAISDDADQQERFREITAQLFAEADALERQPGIYFDPQKASIAEMIAAKHGYRFQDSRAFDVIP